MGDRHTIKKCKKMDGQNTFQILVLNDANLIKVRENQKNDAEISIAILNIPFYYLKLLQLCCLNFCALSFKREGAKEASFLEVKLFTRRHISNHYPALKNFKCRIVIWNI